MRVAWLLAVSVSGCAIVSGLDELDVCDGSCPDVAVRDSGPSDVTSDVTPSEAAASSDASDDIACTKPSDCTSTGVVDAGNVVCCATINTTGQYPQCTYVNEIAKCTSTDTCPTSVSTSGCSTEVFRRCASSVDCLEPTYPKCCVLPAPPNGGGHYCANPAIASAIGGLCP